MVGILGGYLSGRKVISKAKCRPITSLLRKSIFDTTRNFIKDSVSIDLFAGSGILGIETLSRGGDFTYFVEKDFKAIESIKKNIETLNLKNCKIINKDAFKSLSYVDRKANLIFVDPPYAIASYTKIIDYILSTEVLAEHTHIYIKTDKAAAKELVNIGASYHQKAVVVMW